MAFLDAYIPFTSLWIIVLHRSDHLLPVSRKSTPTTRHTKFLRPENATISVLPHHMGVPANDSMFHSIGKLDSVPSAVLVAAQLLFDCPSQALQQELLVPVLTAVLPWSLVHHQSIRWPSPHSHCWLTVLP